MGFLAALSSTALAQSDPANDPDVGVYAFSPDAARRIYDLCLELDRVLDLRDERVCAALSLPDAPACFLDREIARTTASFLRRVARVQAIFVPSLAFLDDPSRWVLVLFLERLDRGLDGIARSVDRDGVLRFNP